MPHSPEVVAAASPGVRGRRAAAWIGGCVIGLTACVTLDLPSIAHVHVGHAITSWTDTPGQRGLFDVAQAEAAVAAEHAGYAVEGARDPAAVRLHLGHVLHAADPTHEPTGPGTGYGLVRAMDGCIDHLGYANEVRDTSANLRAGLPKVLAVLQPLQREARAVAALAAEGRRAADVAQAAAYAQEVRQRSEHVLARLALARQQLSTLLAAEQPPYRTVPRRYLFGLIRLPSGDWAFDLSPAPAQPMGGYR
ncbi:MAG: hypothetical protein JNJ89_06040 [Rubrivivax sp.]|nr:hypothetical protein [Rubrivivax sp.]